jgi:probable rRNA maturation factor
MTARPRGRGRAKASASHAPKRKLTILVHQPRWREVRGVLAKARLYFSLVLDRAGVGPAEATLVLAGDEEVRALNRKFRGKDKSTNVLSFPQPSPNYIPHQQQTSNLGEIILAYETVRAEAVTQGKPFVNHFAHLVVHGILHLLGYDHERRAEARIMERLEAEILSMLGMPNPYRWRSPRRA